MLEIAKCSINFKLFIDNFITIFQLPSDSRTLSKLTLDHFMLYQNLNIQMLNDSFANVELKLQ